jgi:PKD repeat protein
MWKCGFIPVFDANISFDNGCANTDIQFTDLSTTLYGSITGWDWNYGDGSGSTDQNPLYSYNAQGDLYNLFLLSPILMVVSPNYMIR